MERRASTERCGPSGRPGDPRSTPAVARQAVDTQEQRMPLRGMRAYRRRGKQGAAITNRQTRPAPDPITIPRHELPGRIVLSIGLFTSSLCVVGLIILLVG